MITLITATPGGGKTAFAVHEFIQKAADSGRAVLVYNIPDLTVPHEPLPPVADWAESRPSDADPTVEVSRFKLPQGALVVIDECQEVFRVRPSGSKVPAHVSAFERHRHQGLDFVLITQEPALIDSHVRKLVGRHIHIRATGLGRYQYEWPATMENPDKNFRQAPVKLKWKLPKAAFGKYKSASLHVKPVRRVPTAAYLLGACAFLIAGGGWYAYQSISAKMNPAPVASVAKPDQPASGGVVPLPDRPAQPVVGVTVAEFTPRLNGRPESAPLYDGVRVVKSLPVVAGCVAMRSRCTCFTDQGTDAGLNGDQCRAWLENPPFNPYLERPQVAQVQPVGRGVEATELPTRAPARPSSAEETSRGVVIADGGIYAGIPTRGN